MTNQQDKVKVSEWLTSRPAGQDVTPELNNTLRIAVWAIVAVVLGIIFCIMSVLATSRVEGAMQATPCPQNLLFVHSRVSSVNVRPQPNMTNVPIRTIVPAMNPQEVGVRSADGNWWRTCNAATEEYITSDERWTIAITVTPGPTRTSAPTREATQAPVTPTRMVTNTPAPATLKTQVANLIVKEICINYTDADGPQEICHTFPYDAQVRERIFWGQK